MTTRVHYGSYENIPNSASEGLLFLKKFLPILDSLDPAPPISPYLDESAKFVTNRDPPVTPENLSQMHQMRHKMLQLFKHDVSRVFEIPRAGGCTVIFESKSTTQFKGDDVQVIIAEINIWELEREKGTGKLVLVGASCCMDPSAVQNRAKEFFGSK